MIFETLSTFIQSKALNVFHTCKAYVTATPAKPEDKLPLFSVVKRAVKNTTHEPTPSIITPNHLCERRNLGSDHKCLKDYVPENRKKTSFKFVHTIAEQIVLQTTFLLTE